MTQTSLTLTKPGRKVNRTGWRRGSLALEAVLLLPIAVFILGVTAQVMVFAKQRAMAEQAAHAAARSALAQTCSLEPVLDFNALFAGTGSDCDFDRSMLRAAAAWALLNAAPAAGRGGFGNSCKAARDVVDILRAADLPPDLEDATRNKACYVYAAGNLDVEIVRRPLAQPMERSDRAVLEAVVRFKFPINSPIGLFMHDGLHPDGTPWRWGEARMVIA